MRYIVAIILLISSHLTAISQLVPVSFWNLYVYGNANGLNDYNFIFGAQLSDGRLYIKANMNNKSIYCIGSNYVKEIFLADTTDYSILGIARSENDDALVFKANRIFVVKNFSVIKTIKPPSGTQIIYSWENGFCALYNGKKFFLVKIADGHLKVLFESVLEVNYFQSKDGDYIKEVSKFNHRNFNIYKIEKSGKINFENTYTNTQGLSLPISLKKGNKRVFINYPAMKRDDNYQVHFTSIVNNPFYVADNVGEYKRIFYISDTGLVKNGYYHNDGISFLNIRDNASGNGSFYFCSGNMPFRVFPYIHNFPSLFNNSNSKNIFALCQDSIGRIWAGSYNGYLSIINDNIITPVNVKGTRFLNGSLATKNKIVLFKEHDRKVLSFNLKGAFTVLNDSITGFYSYPSKYSENVYFGTYQNNGVWFCKKSDIDTGKPKWGKIDSTTGMTLPNVLTITEDTLRRIWFGQRGLSVYDPKTNKAKTWQSQKNEISFAYNSSLTDKWGTVWLGTLKSGLKYYKDYKAIIDTSDIKSLRHPLIDNKAVSSLIIWDKWLVIGAEDRICMLDLEAWHTRSKTILRYVNPMELNLQGIIEQNVFVVDALRQNLWFSTNENLYKLNLKQWFSLPTYCVQPNVVLQSKNSDTTLFAGKRFYLSPTNNSLKINIWFQTKDNMPRYLSVAMIKEGDTLNFSSPSLENSYRYDNLASGKYVLYVKFFESYGETSLYVYRITIRKFLWQQWWFWVLTCAIIAAGILYYFNLKRKQQLAIEKAKTKEAELETYKAEQEKKLGDLKLITLSNQFRPHFILNALNSIGAKMSDDEDTESVLSRLGESVNIVFDHSRQENFTHSFEKEWKLVVNIIHIHQLMYLKELQTEFPPQKTLLQLLEKQIPMGIIQIPVENALLHGLMNRTSAPWLLKIEIFEDNFFNIVKITDNGVGRAAANMLSNFTKHGTGLKTLSKMFEIINSKNKHKISIEYADDIFEEDGKRFGTAAIIKLPKLFNYGP